MENQSLYMRERKLKLLHYLDHVGHEGRFLRRCVSSFTG